MIFTSFTYLIFLLVVVVGFWLIRKNQLRNVFLLGASYLFYGWVHPWFCILIAVSTSVDYVCALAMRSHPQRRQLWLVASVLMNLGMLGVFKYFGFFAESWEAALGALGFATSPIELRIFLPVGISFYTFQSLSYTIDVYRGILEPRRRFVAFALFVSCFPQLVAGPIERARNLLPQIETPRHWRAEFFHSAWPLILRGYVKKLLVADNVATYVDQIFALQAPSAPLLMVGGFAFAIQIYADFSGYTDIARGSARLLGLHLSENFRAPYSAISPSDFWRRWHISFSSWITDYLYIPLGGSRVRGAHRQFGVLLLTMGLSGLWHGAAWNFVIWGVFHALLLFAYRSLGLGAEWRPEGPLRRGVAWCVMFTATVIGWIIFRAPSLAWLVGVSGNFGWEIGPDSSLVLLVLLLLILFYSSPLLVLDWLGRLDIEKHRVLRATLVGVAVVALAIFARESAQDFIYFQF